MKMTKLSLATLVALGTFSYANAATTLEEAIKGTTINGYAYGRLTSLFGEDAAGTALRTRLFTSVKTEAYHGFSVGTNLIASIGKGTPDGGKFLNNSGVPTKDSVIVNGTAALGIYGLYGEQTFETSKTTIKAGQINLIGAFADNTWDYGYGASVTNSDLEGFTFAFQGVGAWSLDDGNMMPNSSTGFDSDRALFIAGVKGGGEQLAGLNLQTWFAHALKTIDFMNFTELTYSISDVTIGGQVAVAKVNNKIDQFAVMNNPKQDAELRGIYNLQVSYANKEAGFGVKAGYTGSFGDGYGAMLNYATFNMGGQFWYDTAGSNNGYSITGSGGRKHADGSKTDIMVGYIGISYGGVENLALGLDYAYVGGKNNYTLTKVAQSKKGKTNMDATLHELSLTAKYNFNDKLSLAAIVGSTFGDLQIGRARATLQYSF